MTAAPFIAAISREAVQREKTTRCVRSEGPPSRMETRTGGRSTRAGCATWPGLLGPARHGRRCL